MHELGSDTLYRRRPWRRRLSCGVALCLSRAPIEVGARRKEKAVAELSIYERMGGAPVLRRLIDTFYDIIEFEPQGKLLNILHLRGMGVAHSREEQFNFLAGFFGGPKLYIEKHGHSDVREMHRHVQVGPEERDSWLECMQTAIGRVGLEPELSDDMMRHFRVVANALEVENRTNEKNRQILASWK
jgi:hemoglobin